MATAAPPLYVLNPLTGRYLSATGPSARKLIKAGVITPEGVSLVASAAYRPPTVVGTPEEIAEARRRDELGQLSARLRTLETSSGVPPPATMLKPAGDQPRQDPPAPPAVNCCPDVSGQPPGNPVLLGKQRRLPVKKTRQAGRFRVEETSAAETETETEGPTDIGEDSSDDEPVTASKSTPRKPVRSLREILDEAAAERKPPTPAAAQKVAEPLLTGLTPSAPIPVPPRRGGVIPRRVYKKN